MSPRRLLMKLMESTLRILMSLTTVTQRCGGFCGDEATVCVPVKNDTVLVQVQRISDPIVMIELPFVQHSGCSCRSRESLSASFVHF
ncbi:vascular endothelial growth factor B isoform X3 [Colossoma macropomum]|uniref:vascular endothelial growth factor B isoform X3 n=1 Tax=Colossoma macropomum TaxID=42526 RepID=UPI001864B825|nr:vascular endothelial growth factor B isoform X3 [Colossoma macropomum]